MRIMKILEFTNENHKSYENFRIPYERINKIIKILKFHIRIMKIMKNLEFHKESIKSKKSLNSI